MTTSKGQHMDANNSRILIVDDDAKSQKLMRDMLSNEGYDLAFAPTGSTALAEAAHKAPDVILLDVLMPDMDGFEVCRHLRLDPILAEVPILLVTALADRPSRLRGLEAGADDFVTKPVDVIELRTRVRNVILLNRYRKLLRERDRAQHAEAASLASCEATLTALVRIMERNSSAMAGRCDRIMDVAVGLGEAMKLTDLVSLRWSVLLQSIAAMAVPVALRSRDGCLSQGEEDLPFKHEAWIIEALSPVAVLHDALQVLGSLCENWDGSGRPSGLKGEAIPIEARILAVALAWESEQPDGPAETAARLTRFKERAGRRLDPRLVEMIERVADSPHAGPGGLDRNVPVAAPVQHPPPRRPLLQRLSMSSAGARAQFAMAIALISVIPSLAMVSLCMSGWMDFQLTFEEIWPMFIPGVPFAALGYWMLAKYPVNIVRLRRYLESLTQGIIPSRIALVTDEDDLASIEVLMKKVITQTEARVHTIETQTGALLIAERERVMIQSLGAACHHLGQPATVLSSYLQMVLRMELPTDARQMLSECLTAASSVAAILERLQNLTVYRTEPYMQREPGEVHQAADDIVKM